MKAFVALYLILILALSPSLALAGDTLSSPKGDGTIPPYLPPLVFHDISFGPESVQLGLNDYGRGIETATVYLDSDGVKESFTLTQTIYSTANTSWLTAPLPRKGEWKLRQLYAKDKEGNELNVFFIAAAPVPEPAEGKYKLYLPHVSN